MIGKVRKILFALALFLSAIAVGCAKQPQPGGGSNGDNTGGNGGNTTDERGVNIAIEIENCGEIEVQAGERFSLPHATAADENGNDFSDSIKIRCSTATIVADTFVAYTAMDHIVYYYLYDAADNMVCENIVVSVLPKTQETTLPEGENDLENLKTEGKVFAENFAKGNNSPLVSGSLSQKMYVGATEDSISGNSLIMDWTDTSGVYAMRISDVAEYISHAYGQYTIAFDLKLISGAGDPTWYFGIYNIELATDEERSFANKNVDLSALKAGDKIHLEKEFLLEANGTFYLEFFTLTASTEMSIAIDNVTIVYDTVGQDVPEIAEAKSGYTWDWREKSMKVTAGGIAATPDRIVSSGFGSRVLRLSTGGYHDFTATQGIFESGTQYKISFNYCIETSRDIFYFMVKNNALSEDENIAESTKVYWDTTPWKTGTIEYTFTATDEHTLFSVLTGYAGGTIYIGDFTVEAAEKKEYTLPSQEALESGYTFKYTSDLPVSYQDWINHPYSGPYVYTENFVNKPVDIQSETFSSTALRINNYGYTRFDFTKGLFKAGEMYEVSFEYSIYNTIEAKNGVCFWIQNSKNDKTNGDGVFPKASWNGSRYHTQKFTGTFKAVDGDDEFSIYVVPGSRSGYIVIYVSEITVKKLKPLTIPTDAELKSGYTFEISPVLETAKTEWGNPKSVEFIETDAAMKANGFGSRAIFVQGAGTGRSGAGLKFLEKILGQGNTYSISFRAAFRTQSGQPIYYTNGGNASSVICASPKDLTYTDVEMIFTAGANAYPYFGANEQFTAYIGDITVTELLHKPTEEELKAGYTFRISKALEFSKPTYGNPSVSYKAATAELKANGFGEQVVYAAGQGHSDKGVGMKFLENILTKGKQYKISFRVAFRCTGTTVDNIIYTDEDGTLNVYCYPKNEWLYSTFDKTFTPNDTNLYPMFGSNQPFEMYMGDITVTQIA